MRKILAMLLLLPLSAFAASYFVTQSGSGNQNGTSLSDAWSVSTFNSSGVPTGGDTVFFSGPLTSSVSPNSSGNSTAVLTLDFTGATFTTGNIHTDHSISYVTFNGGTFASTNSSGVLVTIGSGTTADHCTFQGMSYNGPSDSSSHPMGFMWGSQPGGGTVTFLTIQNCTVVNSSDCVMGSDQQSHDISILNNYFQTNPNTTEQTDVIFVSDCWNMLIQGNKIVNGAPGSASNSRHNDCMQTFRNGSSGGTAGNPHDWTICYNWFEIRETGGDGNNSAGMMEMMGNNVFIYGNVWYVPAGDAGNGLCFDNNNAGNTYFYNNTLWGIPANLCRYIASSGSTLFARNNICVGASYSTCVLWTYSVGATWDYNYLSQGVISGTASCTGPHGSSANPLLSNPSGQDFSLPASSPCRNAGDSTIGSKYNQGIAPGATWPNPKLAVRQPGAWDIGAYQSSGTNVPIAPGAPANLHLVSSASP